MRHRLHPHAEEEVLEAASWYEDQVKGLGFDLLTEVDHWLTVLPETPKGLATVAGCPECGPASSPRNLEKISVRACISGAR